MARDPAMGPITRYDEKGNTIIGDVQLPPPTQVEAIPETPPKRADLKTVILAGGRGSRLQDETQGRIPKPLVKIGLMPMLQHIIYIYSGQKHNQFIIAGGHKADMIMDWHEVVREVLKHQGLSVLVTDTGPDTQTGGRLLRLRYYLSKPFMMTYGDGLADINLAALLEFHEMMVAKHGVLVTLSAVKPPARFGNLTIEDGLAKLFVEKSQASEGWINGGFYVIQPEALNLITGDTCSWEFDVLPVLAVQGRLAAYQHPGYFQMCDTARDLDLLRKTWKQGNAPWARLSI